MCILCIEIQKQKLTAHEARRALGEMVFGLPEGHAEEVEALIETMEESPAKTVSP